MNPNEPGRLKMGAVSTKRPGMIFHRYSLGKEAWVTPERFARIRGQNSRNNEMQRAKPNYLNKRRNYDREYQNKPGRKAYRSFYYGQPHVRARYRERYASDPVVRQKAKDYSRTPKARAAQKRHRSKPEVKAKSKAYMKEYWPLYHKERYANDPDYRAACQKSARESAKRNRVHARRYENEKYRTNIQYKLGKNLRSRINGVLRQRPGAIKIGRTEELIGCSISTLRGHLEKQFVDDMSWESFMAGKIEIDHQTPLSLFDLTDPKQQRAAFHFSNLCPLWMPDNRRKSDFIKHDGKRIRARDLRKTNIIPFQAVA